MEIFTAVFILVAAFFTMFLGALSGGIGLIMRPLLLFIGFSPQIVIGTSRASAILGEAPGVIVIHKTKKTDRKRTLFLTIPVLIGMLFGTFFAITASSKFLRISIACLVLLTAIFMIVHKDLGKEQTKPKFSKPIREIISFIGTIFLAFFTIISGGLGPVVTAFYSWLYGETYTIASSTRKIAGYLGTAITSIIFLFRGFIDWQLFVLLSIGFATGSYFGTHYALKKGENWTKNIIIVVAIASAVVLLIK